MKTLSVQAGSRHYPIYLGSGTWEKLASFLKERTERIAVITSKAVFKKLGREINALLKFISDKDCVLVLPDGEKYKNQATLNRIYTWLLRKRYDRETFLLALGGGVIGDIAGYAAATFMRGIPFVQVPTTLLAMVDSSIGGKVAVNHPLGKNMIGNFYQPRAVYMDTCVFKTLPVAEFESGMAEVIKHGMIADADYFSFLENKINQILCKDEEVLIKAIEGSCKIKADIVRKDEKEKGIRAVLNYGHTFAHALEAVTKYKYYRHGEAVMHGMRAAGYLGYLIQGFSQDNLKRQNDLLGRLKGKKLPKLKIKDLHKAISHDKKASRGKMRFIVLQNIGKAAIRSDINPGDIHASWKAIGI